jgi:hypothetical protein
MAQTPYSQDFEGMTQVNGELAADNWLNYGNVFDPGGAFIYGYGPFAAVNNIGNWQDIATGQSGPEQGANVLVVYSDYANGNHGSGNWVESNCYQEQQLPVGVSGTWCFEFDAKLGDLGGASTALAFIKVLNPADWSMPVFETYETTNLPTTWGTYSISADLTGLDQMILQFGFLTKATNYEPCGVFYDNLDFYECSISPVEASTWSAVKALYR